MDTEDITRKCDSCKEPVSIDATKCPHCQSRQITGRYSIAVAVIVGVIGLPFSYVAIPVAINQGVPNGLAEGIGTGIAWGIGLIGPIFLLAAIGAYMQRREAIQEAKNNS